LEVGPLLKAQFPSSSACAEPGALLLPQIPQHKQRWQVDKIASTRSTIRFALPRAAVEQRRLIDESKAGKGPGTWQLLRSR
jgi:hypothetical protein